MEKKNQVPVDSVNVDQLPKESALTYDEMCVIVGSLYIDNHHQIKIIKEQSTSLINMLQERIRNLTDERTKLVSQIKLLEQEISDAKNLRNRTKEEAN